jgi:DNA polymerase III subunit delta'
MRANWRLAKTFTTKLVSSTSFKFLPLLVEDLIGRLLLNIQSKPVQRLLEKALQGRVSAAYLFCGSAGVGKRTTARWFANQLVGSPLDLFWVEPTLSIEGNLLPISSDEAKKYSRAIAQIRLEQIHAIQSQWGLTSHKAKRVVVIDSVQQMSVDAGSALLKIMEESVTTVFILITDLEDRLLSTVRSRCQIVRFEHWDNQAFHRFVENQCSMLLDYPSLLSFTRGCPGQAIAAIEVVSGFNIQLRQDLIELSKAGWSVVDSFNVMPELAGLGHQEIVWLLSYMQHSLWISRLEVGLKRQGIALIEESFQQVRSHCQRQSIWETLIWQLCLKKIGWRLELPVPQLSD